MLIVESRSLNLVPNYLTLSLGKVERKRERERDLALGNTGIVASRELHSNVASRSLLGHGSGWDVAQVTLYVGAQDTWSCARETLAGARARRANPPAYAKALSSG